ncbi:MAG TPA: polysaccharide biosynthesis/export family protein [Pyrinomonadaceae bacterium]|nr:polysaccharide biosynthesis/export family protein [Pyrinomonadaceae bacterium]
MKLRFILFCMFFGCLGFIAVVQGQDPAQGQNVPQPAGVDNQGIRNYLLGPGDVLDVRVFGQPDLNAMVEVDSEGNLSSLPFLETPIPAKCRTEKQVQKDIAAAYEKYLKNPQISVRITEHKSRQPATVNGAVRQPARIQMQRKVRLNELMAASGGFTERAAGTIQILHTEPVMCPEPGEEREAAPIDATKIPLQIIKISDLKAGKLEANPIIRPGDYVLVSEAEPVYITGSVHSPQGVYMRDQLTLGRALAMVGGVRKEAKTDDIRIYRQKAGSTEQEVIKVDYAAIKKNQKPDVQLQAFDVIDVPEAGMFSKGRFASTLVGAVSGGLQSVFSSAGLALPTRVIY